MPERKEHDPMQELRERAGKLIATHETEEAERLVRERARVNDEAWEASAAAIRLDAPEVRVERDSTEAKRRKACLDAIIAKLKEQGETLSPESSLLLSLLMERLHGNWNDFDNDEVTLATVRVNADNSITIAFAFYGSLVGEKTLPLRAS